jgi:Tol biopolymer transport system component
MKYVAILLFLTAVASSGDWQDPVNLGSNVNSSGIDFHPTVNEERTYLIFASDRPGGEGLWDLWRIDYSGDAWQTPVNLGPNVNTTNRESTPFLAENDTKLFLASQDPGGSAGWDIWWCTITGDGEPGIKIKVGPPVNTEANEFSPVLSADGNTLYFTSDRPGGYGGYDIWESVKSGGSWGTPVNIGGAVNSDVNDYPNWLSDDGTVMVLTSQQSGTLGDNDIWRSDNVGGSWQSPINFGSPINTAEKDMDCTLYCNHGGLGGMMYFSSTRSGGFGHYDLYVSVHSDYVTVSPASLGEIKATFR